MKKLNYNLTAFCIIAVFTLIYSCKKVLDKAPTGVLAGATLANKAGVDGLLIGAYSLLDGYYQGQPGTNYGSGISNWTFGGIGSDDAYKGSTTVDQAPDAPSIEQHAGIATNNAYLYSKWQVSYAGIARANSVLQEIPLVKDGSETTAVANETMAEAKFLRAIYHFELAKVWRNVPYVDETIAYSAGNYNVTNASGGKPVQIWDKIEADLIYAMQYLPKTQGQAGRANYYAAEAFLAKAYLYDNLTNGQHSYAKALPLLNDCIANGTTAGGTKYALVTKYNDNFNASTRNNAESIFAAQFTVNDGSGGQNDDGGDILNFPGGGTYTGCCGFYVPSYNLANSFKVDANGLPMFNIDAGTGFPTYNVKNLGNDHGVDKGDTTFFPTTELVDSRLDWTVGRRGIPYLDWGICAGESWTRGDLSSYTPIKHSFYHATQASTTDASIWGATGQGNSINYNLMRVPDLYLMRAECEVWAGQLSAAEADVNVVRARAANNASWVMGRVYDYDTSYSKKVSKFIRDASKPKVDYTKPAANYKVGLYSGQFAANGATWAWQAIICERQLEFGMEGYRFFDLQRMDARFGGPMPAGYMFTLLNAYYKADNRIPNPVLSIAKFAQGRDEVYPIPLSEIDKEGKKVLLQNAGYDGASY